MKYVRHTMKGMEVVNVQGIKTILKLIPNDENEPIMEFQVETSVLFDGMIRELANVKLDNNNIIGLNRRILSARAVKALTPILLNALSVEA